MNKIEYLIIDDEELDRELLKRYLSRSKYNFDVHEANNGENALVFIREYDAILEKNDSPPVGLLIYLDINMPIMNGFGFMDNLAQEVQRLKRLHPMIIQMLTSSTDESDRKRAASNNLVKGYLVKFPKDISIFDKVVENSGLDLN